jgi:hypothetical protein
MIESSRFGRAAMGKRSPSERAQTGRAGPGALNDDVVVVGAQSGDRTPSYCFRVRGCFDGGGTLRLRAGRATGSHMIYYTGQSEDTSHQLIEAGQVRERRRTRSMVSIRQRRVDRDSTTVGHEQSKRMRAGRQPFSPRQKGPTMQRYSVGTDDCVIIGETISCEEAVRRKFIQAAKRGNVINIS